MLIEKINRVHTILEQRIREKEWDVDWDTYAKHQKEADEHLQKKDLSASFRSHCRALTVLTQKSVSAPPQG